MSKGGGIPAEALLDLRRRLDDLAPRDPERRIIIEGAANMFGVSRATVYRALAGQLRPKGLRCVDWGEPRKTPRADMERYCEIIAALKIRTSNKKGRKLSTARAIELLENFGVETPDGLIKAPEGTLHPVTVNRYLRFFRNLPATGIRQMCSWERFCAFAREPETRKVAGDARIRIDGTFYEVDPDLAGETVTLWWGLFDHELFVERNDKRFGPYLPSGGPIPLHRYRKPRKGQTQARADRIGDLAKKISVPRAALIGAEHGLAHSAEVLPFDSQPFVDPDPYGQFTYQGRLDALRGIADLLCKPLARLAEDDLAFVNALVDRTLDKATIKQEVTARLSGKRPATNEESN